MKSGINSRVASCGNISLSFMTMLGGFLASFLCIVAFARVASAGPALPVSFPVIADAQYNMTPLGVAQAGATTNPPVLKDSYSASSNGQKLTGGPQDGQVFDEEASNGVLSAMRVTVTSAYTISQFQLQMCRYGTPQRYLIGAVFSDSVRTDQNGKTNHQPGEILGSWSAPVYDGDFPENTGTNYGACTQQTFSGVNAPVSAGTYWIVISSTGQTCSGSPYATCTCRTSNTCSTTSSCTLSTCGAYAYNISYSVGTRTSSTYGDSHLQPGLTGWGEFQTSQVNYWLYSAASPSTGTVPSPPVDLTISKADSHRECSG